VRIAENLGFLTNAVSDATFAFDKTDYAGTLRVAAEVPAMSLANLEGKYATMASAQNVLDLLDNMSLDLRATG